MAAGEISTSFERSADFIETVWKNDGPASEMHVGDLCWGVFHSSPPALGSLRLWSADGDLPQAFTMYDGKGVCDLVVRHGREGLRSAALALDWAESRCCEFSSGRRSVELRVGRRVNQELLRDLLKGRGFIPQLTGFPAMHRLIDIDDVAQPVVPKGYEVRQLRPNELDERVRAFGAAFPDDALSIGAYQALRQCSPYRPGLDVVIAAPDSTIAAFATLWIDTSNAVVQVEPAGCHPDHRRLGLTRAAILHALAAAAHMGAREALVRSSSENFGARRLYESCGFRVASDRFGFAKTIDLTG